MGHEPRRRRRGTRVDTTARVVSGGDIEDNSLSTSKYQDGSVTAQKVAPDVHTQAEADAHAGTPWNAAHPAPEAPVNIAGFEVQNVGAPLAAGSAARLAEVTAVDNALTTHEADEDAVHGSTPAATAGKIIQRDAAGRAKVAAPAAVDDIARKDTVDAAEASAKAYADTVAKWAEVSSYNPAAEGVGPQVGWGSPGTFGYFNLTGSYDDATQKTEANAQFEVPTARRLKEIHYRVDTAPGASCIVVVRKNGADAASTNSGTVTGWKRFTGLDVLFAAGNLVALGIESSSASPGITLGARIILVWGAA